jgi:hypothetical protein
MADALITDQEIAILCDVLEGSGANLNANKRKVLDQRMLSLNRPTAKRDEILQARDLIFGFLFATLMGGP